MSSFHVAHFHHHYTFQCPLQSRELGLGEPSDEGLTISGFLCIPGVCCWHVLAGRMTHVHIWCLTLPDMKITWVMMSMMSESEKKIWVIPKPQMFHCSMVQLIRVGLYWFTVTILPLLCPSPILDFLLGCLLCQALAVLPKQFLISADAPASWVPMGARSLCLWRTNCSLRWNHVLDKPMLDTFRSAAINHPAY